MRPLCPLARPRIVAAGLLPALGTVTISKGCVKLTARGERLASFSRYFRQHLLPRQRLLMGTYTDRLTDPFANGDGVAGAANRCD